MSIKYLDLNSESILLNPKTPFSINGASDVNSILKLLSAHAGFSIDAVYEPVTWLFDENTPIYGIGDNLTKAYNCWCPHNLQYDPVRDRFIFVQCHKSSHTGSNFIDASMHIVYPNDPLKRTDITIPSIIGIANLLILDDGTYLLYPKTLDGIRYISTDGGATWASQNITGDADHFFGVYYCNGDYYAGCDNHFREYHYSEDGLNWTTRSIDWEDQDGCPTKEHSFCYWKGHVYAFGRRDFYIDGGSIAPNNNGCAVVFRLDGDTWTMVDDSSLLAFQSNCSPVAFGECIAIAHINRVSNPSLHYTLYDGETFTTLDNFTNLTLPGSQAAMTTPSLAFGNGYACIAFSVMPVLNNLSSNSYDKCINTMIIGTYESKTTKDYFTYHTLENFNIAKSYYESQDAFSFYPTGAETNITWRWNTGNFDNIVNNNNYDVYFSWNDYPCMYYKLLSNDGCYPIYNGEFVDTTVLGESKTGAITHNWIMDYDNRHFAIGGKGNDYGGVYVNTPRQFVLECSLSASSTQPSVDLTNVPNGTVIRTLSANGGIAGKAKGDGSYLIFNN